MLMRGAWIVCLGSTCLGYFMVGQVPECENTVGMQHNTSERVKAREKQGGSHNEGLCKLCYKTITFP